MKSRSYAKDIISGIRTGFTTWSLIGILWGIVVILTHLERPFTLLDLPLFRLFDGWQVDRVATYKLFVPFTLDRIEFLFLSGIAHAALGLFLGLTAGIVSHLLWGRSAHAIVGHRAWAFQAAWYLCPLLFLLIMEHSPTIGKGPLIPPLIPRVLAIQVLIAVVIAAVVFWFLYRAASRSPAGDADITERVITGRLVLILCIMVLVLTGVSSQLGKHLASESFEEKRSAAAGKTGETGDRARNVILIIIDTLRVDHLGCYGYERPLTPHIDELAADGIRFDHCIVQAPWTIPSIMSIMTSMYPSVNGIMDDKGRLDPIRQTLAEAFQAEGFRTAGIVSHTFVDSRYGFGDGFEIFEDERVIQEPADQITELAISILEEVKDERFFLFIHYFDPHFPYEPPAPFDTIQVTPGVDVESMSWKEMKRFAHIRNPVPQPELNRIIGLYDGEIAFTDVMIGHLIDYLKTSGLYENTIIALTADHGEEFKDHGSMGHTRTLYDEVIRVPLLIRDPGSGARGIVIEEQVRSMDIAPTLLRGAGIEIPVDFQGVDLSNFWSDQRPVSSLTAFSETSRHAILRSIRTDDNKYIQNIRRSFYHTIPGVENTHELYDLREDAKELRDQKDNGDPPLIPLRNQLFEWVRISELEQDWLPKAGGEEKVTYDQETLNRLRALGYVQ
jgi:arylsulfatase A-like enzyme